MSNMHVSMLHLHADALPCCPLLCRDLGALNQLYLPGALLQQPDALVELISMVKGEWGLQGCVHTSAAAVVGMMQ